MLLLTDIYNKFNGKDEKRLIIFSTEEYLDNELGSEWFSKYDDDACVKRFLNKKNEQKYRSRYLYIEKIEDKKNCDVKRSGTLTYVMLNPSYADDAHSDSTMNRARKWTSVVRKENNEGYEYFAVINLFSYRHHKPAELKNILKKYDDSENFAVIQKFLDIVQDQAQDFVIAYGVSDYTLDTQPEILKDKKQNLIKILKDKNKNLKTFYEDGKPYHISSRKKAYDDKNQLHLRDISEEWLK